MIKNPFGANHWLANLIFVSCLNYMYWCLVICVGVLAGGHFEKFLVRMDWLKHCTLCCVLFKIRKRR